MMENIVIKYPHNRAHRNSRGFVLLEVLLSMTILAISGGILVRTLMTAMDASRTTRDVTKAVMLTKIKLHEFEMAYNNKANDVYGEFRGNYNQEGAAKFY
ncbi:prepilin-type N-terminal cleavage/methylation domain-containing protein, partial [bacterium]|nr:prepilin-type N-terminal cleavage/methylation domain-containing protein [bacterium]